MVFVGVLLALFSAEAFSERDFTWAVGFAVAAILFILIPALFTPYCYAFDKNGVSLRYVFFPEERYLWNNVRSIEVDIIFTSGRTHFFDLFYAWVFKLEGKNEGKHRFYMQGHIRKSFRTKRLLEKYWDGTITGYLFEDAKAWLAKRRAKKEAYVKRHLADDVIQLEREVRSEVREILNPFVIDAKKHGLELKTKYLYVTKDYRELKSRPNEKYTYTVNLELFHEGETDEGHKAIFPVELLYVRLGKECYRAVKSTDIREIIESLSETLDDICKNGIEDYYEYGTEEEDDE